jgi:hypothetical protein
MRDWWHCEMTLNKEEKTRDSTRIGHIYGMLCPPYWMATGGEERREDVDMLAMCIDYNNSIAEGLGYIEKQEGCNATQ